MLKKPADFPRFNPDPRPPATGDRLRLRAGTLTVELAPSCGGSLTSFYLSAGARRVELFRTADQSRIEANSPLGAACFPMVPYAGRLRNGSFQYGTRRTVFPLNALPEHHSSHGDGWTRRWRTIRHSRSWAVLKLEPVSEAPIRYRCHQFISLTESGLRIRLRIWNDEAVPIPVGFGLHPYFARRGDATLTARLPLRWQFDDELMPVDLHPNEWARRMSEGADISSLPNHVEYWGWDGEATVSWPSDGLKVAIRTQPVLRAAVLWAPAGADFFCFEPISHATDVFNYCEGQQVPYGLTVLKPGAQIKQDIHFDLIESGDGGFGP